MNFTWSPDQEPPEFKVTKLGWLLVVLRAVPLALVLFLGVVVMAIMRVAEYPIFGAARPLTPWITVCVCRVALRILGVRASVEGSALTEKGAMVANHSSWLDIFVLNSVRPLYFVSKAEVAGWPGIGLLARITGTVFIARDRREAKAQQEVFETRLKAGHLLLFFPEGTSTDGFRVLPFKSTLFQAFFDPTLRDNMHIQPVTVVYSAPDNEDPRHFGWWGDMDFGPHALKLLASPRSGAVTIVYHQSISVSSCEDRKTLAVQAEEAVRSGMPEERRVSG